MADDTWEPRAIRATHAGVGEARPAGPRTSCERRRGGRELGAHPAQGRSTCGLAPVHGRGKWLFTDRVGNLCLLQKGPNGRIGNKPWSIKQRVLAASELKLTAEAATAPDWTPRAIAD